MKKFLVLLLLLFSPIVHAEESPLGVWQTEKFTIKIDKLNQNTNTFRYTSWSRGKSMQDEPDLVLENGDLIFDGNGGNRRYQFKNGRYVYVLFYDFVSEEDVNTPYELTVHRKRASSDIPFICGHDYDGDENYIHAIYGCYYEEILHQSAEKIE